MTLTVEPIILDEPPNLRPSQLPRGTSIWQHIDCRECGWTRSVQLNAKPSTIRKGFRVIGEHFAAHRETVP